MDYSIFPKLFLLSVGLMLLGDAFFKCLNIREIRGIQRIAVNFWAGYFIFGVLFFISSYITPLSIYSVFVLITIGFPFVFWRTKEGQSFVHTDKGHFFSLLFLLSAALTFPSALVPPVEGASLSNFYSVSRFFAEAGSLTLTPYAIAQTAPLQSQIMGTAAYLLGGEGLMLLFNWFCAFMAGLAVFTLARRRLQVAQSWLLTVLIFTIPVLSKTAGTGIVEPKLLGATCLAVWAILIYARSEHPKWLIVTALFTACVLSLSYLGIFIAFAVLVAVILSAKDFGWKYGPCHIALFIVSTLVLSCAWYVWNFLQTGNAFFPFMGGNDIAMQQLFAFKEIIPAEERHFSGLFTYPYELVKHQGEWSFQYGSLGPIFMMTLLPALFYFLKHFPFISWEKQLNTSTLLISMFIAFYCLWFLCGYSLDPIALLPVLPMIVLPVWEMANTMRAQNSMLVRGAIISGLMIVLAMQMGMSVNINESPISVFFMKEDSKMYVAENDPASHLADQLKKRLNKQDKVMYTNIDSLNYHLGAKGVHAASILQSNIPITTENPIELLNALMRQHITHWVTENNASDTAFDSETNGHKALRKLVEYGCFTQTFKQEQLYVYTFIPHCAGKI